MNKCCSNFHKGDEIASLVYHPPEIESGTRLTIVSAHCGTLYAVMLPNGEYHRWIADHELICDNNYRGCKIGDSAIVVSDTGHHSIQKGMRVQIIKAFPNTKYYDLRLENGKYHRWLADFEITCPF